jgi:hypothetical protein
MEIDIQIPESERQQIINALFKLAERLSPAQMKKILRTSANKSIVPALRKAAPVGDKVHYTYSTPGIPKGKRAPKGSGVVRGVYNPGNLRSSLKVLPLRRMKSGIQVGAFANRNGKGEFGTGNPSGYYAHMVEAREKFIKPAADQSTPAFLAMIRERINNEIKATTR